MEWVARADGTHSLGSLQTGCRPSGSSVVESDVLCRVNLASQSTLRLPARQLRTWVKREGLELSRRDFGREGCGVEEGNGQWDPVQAVLEWGVPGSQREQVLPKEKLHVSHAYQWGRQRTPKTILQKKTSQFESLLWLEQSHTRGHG